MHIDNSQKDPSRQGKDIREQISLLAYLAQRLSEGADKYVIDPDTCIDCGACEGGCPAGVISAE